MLSTASRSSSRAWKWRGKIPSGHPERSFGFAKRSRRTSYTISHHSPDCGARDQGAAVSQPPTRCRREAANLLVRRRMGRCAPRAVGGWETAVPWGALARTDHRLIVRIFVAVGITISPSLGAHTQGEIVRGPSTAPAKPGFAQDDFKWAARRRERQIDRDGVWWNGPAPKPLIFRHASPAIEYRKSSCSICGRKSRFFPRLRA